MKVEVFSLKMWTIGPEEMVVVFVVALLLFGPKELPKIGKTLGKAMTEFRRAQTELKSTFDREMKKPGAGKSELTRNWQPTSSIPTATITTTRLTTSSCGITTVHTIPP